MNSAKRKTKPKGRPSSTMLTDAREKLLDAAVMLFAEQGVSATSLAQIAEKADVTPALIHYYFKTREQLLDVVAEERLLRLFSFMTAPESELDWDNPAHLVAMVMDHIIHSAMAMPWLPELWIKEAVTAAGVLRARVIRLMPPNVVLRFVQTIEKGQADGLINPDINAHFILNTILGIVMFPLCMDRSWRGKSDKIQVTAESLARHGHALLLNGLVVKP